MNHHVTGEWIRGGKESVKGRILPVGEMNIEN
jgi:hypothetical protein